MSIFANLLILVAAADALITSACLQDAPEGFEDENGFHLGRKPAPLKARSIKDYHPAGRN